MELIKRGIEQVRQFLNIDRNNIIAFGDEDNDIEMIEYARHGVAMENGLQELKDVRTILHSTIMKMALVDI